ncbi:hypothetical protein GCM10010298_35950 [Streptomyces microflavus]|uniref:Uncharacterized protein n=1 Tax=Streptomyces microflavus TaxID=1919 RepID=A0A7J0D3X7_STRMI|nr:hypothetical protein Smic_79990 [Streptomyces microflavus]GGX67893.1 hypothetical protein GCM10010298_35950 [Streptomyces microflavus]
MRRISLYGYADRRHPAMVPLTWPAQEPSGLLESEQSQRPGGGGTKDEPDTIPMGTDLARPAAPHSEPGRGAPEREALGPLRRARPVPGAAQGPGVGREMDDLVREGVRARGREA